MTDSNAKTAKRPKTESRRRPATDTPTGVNGDPGVGGLLADPQQSVSKAERRGKTPTGAPSPDPEPPKAHGDWAPNRSWRR